MSEGMLDAIRKILEIVFNTFGSSGTIFFVILIFFLCFGWRKYNDSRKDKDTNTALAEKERTIQRLSNEVRFWKEVYLSENKGWPPEKIERLLITEDFADPAEYRKFSESRKHISQKKETKEK